MNNIILISKLLFLLIFFETPLITLAQAGSLDLSFDTDGKQTTPIGTSDDYGNSVAIQSDGKIIVTGYSENGIYNHIALVRYNTNGSLDNTFDFDGKVTTSIGSTSDATGNSVAIQSDGKILVAGNSFYSGSGDFALVRYNTNGSLDTTFDNDGIVITAVGGSTDLGQFVALQSDGKILVAGSSHNGTNFDFALTRYNTNGSLDNTFDTDGKVTTSIGAFNDYGLSLVIQPNGKIVVAGQSFISTYVASFGLIRYNTNGSLDSTFDNDGIATTSIGTVSDNLYSVKLDINDKIVVGGNYRINGTNADYVLARYNVNGSLDSTLDGDGIVITSAGNNVDEDGFLSIQNDGKMVIAGTSCPIPSLGWDFYLVRYNYNGSIDSTFDTDGIASVSFNSYDDMSGIAIQSDGKIVVAGFTDNGISRDFAIARININIVTETYNIESLNKEIRNYPNPFSDFTIINSSTDFKCATLSLYNIYGQLVKRTRNITGNSITFYRDNLPNGLYVLQIAEDNNVVSRCRIIISN